MLERSLMQTHGFRNIETHGTTTGFQLRVRLPSYRGMRLSLIDGVDVTVDGELFGHERNRLSLGGRTYSLAELREATDARWPLEEAAVVIVDKQGGLTPGVHEVELAVRLRQPYIPIEFQPSVISETRHATIVF